MNATPMPAPMPLTKVLGQPALHLSSPDGARATVLLHGGHVVSWCPAGGNEQLYLSERAVAGPGQAVRGGVPVIFPQFEQRAPGSALPRHGLARTRLWALDGHQLGQAHAQATLVLSDTPETRALWPHGFRLELTVSVGGPRLDLELHAENTGTSAWSFAAALHTYLAVSELSAVRLQGLEGCHYTDSLLGGEATEDHPEKRFHGEIDRIYAQAPALLLRDGARQLAIESHNLPDAVIWNPGPEQCAGMKDMPPDGWQRMLCVEAARILNPLTLQAGESWTGRQSLSVLSA